MKKSRGQITDVKTSAASYDSNNPEILWRPVVVELKARGFFRGRVSKIQVRPSGSSPVHVNVR
jgi:hypothetical protein